MLKRRNEVAQILVSQTTHSLAIVTLADNIPHSLAVISASARCFNRSTVGIRTNTNLLFDQLRHGLGTVTWLVTGGGAFSGFRAWRSMHTYNH